MQVISGKVQKAKKVVIYGPEGIGKSSLAGRFPRPVFIDTEGSTTEMDVDRVPKPTSWTMLNEQVRWVWQQGNRFGTLVIDTVDWAEMLAVSSVCAIHNKSGVEDFGYGKGYVFVAEEIGRFLNLLQDVVDSGIHVVLTAHAQIIKFEQPDEMGAYDRYQLKLGAKTGSRTAPLVKEWADMVLFINYKTFSVAADEKGKKHKAQGGTRTMYTTHHPAWDAKNRHGLPDELPLDYGHIAHIFDGVVQPSTSQAPVTPPLVNTQPAAPPAQPVTPPPASVQTPAPSAPAQVADTSQGLNPNIPASLRDLMLQYHVTENDIQIVVSNKGYYPIDTPIANYDPGFVDGVLVGAWQQVHGMVQDMNKQIPFS